MALNLLLVSRDTECVQMWNRASNDAAIDIELLHTDGDATRRLGRQKYNAVVIDFDLPGSPSDLVEQVRKSSTNSGAVIVAMVSNTGDAIGAFRAGASMSVDKRLTIDWVRRCLRAAHTTMVSDRRRYFRYPVSLAAKIQVNGELIEGKIVNISELGLGFALKRQPEIGAQIVARYRLPSTMADVECTGRVVWSTAQGRAGFRVGNMDSGSRTRVRGWLTAKLDTLLKTPAYQA
jgi:ActR/RegA family two-component response regulator